MENVCFCVCVSDCCMYCFFWPFRGFLGLLLINVCFFTFKVKRFLFIQCEVRQLKIKSLEKSSTVLNSLTPTILASHSIYNIVLRFCFRFSGISTAIFSLPLIQGWQLSVNDNMKVCFKYSCYISNQSLTYFGKPCPIVMNTHLGPFSKLTCILSPPWLWHHNMALMSFCYG